MRSKNHKLVVQLALVAIAMFGFGYTLVPLYERFCQLTGFGGKTVTISASEAQASVASERSVEVSFTSHSQSTLPWQFKPLSKRMQVRLGKVYEAYYYVKNDSDRAITGIATFNVTPPRAGNYFNKLECFCFNAQELQPHEEKRMLVRFMLANELPHTVPQLTLSYTFFNRAGGD